TQQPLPTKSEARKKCNLCSRRRRNGVGLTRMMHSPLMKPISLKNLVFRLSSISLPISTTGHPALIGRHRPFPVTHKAADRWLQHMQQALDSVTDIDEDSKIKMNNFFRHTAFFLVAGDELKNQNQSVACKHAANKPAAE
ncbi:hypothetical protein AABB24_014335, partial [Solanum stoloniferum]